MKDIFQYFSLFMWRMVYLEKRDVQLDSYETNYAARQFNLFVRLIMDYKDSFAGKITLPELQSKVAATLALLKAEVVVGGYKENSIQQFKVPMQLIDPVMKLINEVSYLDTVVELGVVVKDNDSLTQDVFNTAGRLQDAVVKLRDFFEFSKDKDLVFNDIVKSEVEVSVES